jgi:hypothetical protein
VKTRSITTNYTVNVLRQLYADFTNTDPTVRIVMLLTVFLSDSTLVITAVPQALSSMKGKLGALNLLPLTKEDLFNVMTNPFVEKHTLLLEYAKEDMEMSVKEIKGLVQEVAIKCLEIGSKVDTSLCASPLTDAFQGKTLRKLAEAYSLHAALADAAMQRYRLSLDDLPPADDEKACAAYEAPLCRDFSNLKVIRANANPSSSSLTPGDSAPSAEPGEPVEATEAEMDGREEDADEIVVGELEEETPINSDGPDLVRVFLYTFFCC